MKKLWFLPLALALAVALSITAMADNTRNATDLSSLPTIPVTGVYQESTGGETVYSLDIAWGDMRFVYIKENLGTWDPATHTYKDAGTNGWSHTPAGANGELAGNVIQVTNHSNTGIVCRMDYTANSGYDNIQGSFNRDSMTLSTAVGKGLNDPTLTGSMELNIYGGALSDSVFSAVTIGSVTLSVQPKT